ncbi:unnamed protein product [Somion occarium]|uniref:F-box domain-containing protein n=1 Tax=Somion occarium TaxID=3059160 RepID=A0ABP1E4M7_9APHY
MVVSTWTAPQRRVGAKLLPLPPLPIDIYLLVLDQFVYEPDLQSLSEYKASLLSLTLVCRFFCAMVTPKLFNELVFDGDDDCEIASMSYGPHNAWFEAASSGDQSACALMKKVKKFTLSNWRDEDDPDEWKESECGLLILRTFSRFSSITELNILRTPIADDFMIMVYQLPNLRSLNIKECVFLPLADPLPQPNSEMLRHRPLRLRELQLGHVDNFKYYRKSMALFVTTSALRILKTSDSQLARQVMKKQMEIPLECLEIPLVPGDASILSDFLNRTPTITELWLESGGFEDDEPPPPVLLDIHPDALPNLKELHCPTPTLPQLLPKRPVTSVNLVESQDWMFAKCYDNELVVPYAMYSELPLYEFIPKVDTLVVCLPLVLSALPCRGILRALCTVHERKPIMRHLKLLPFGGINVVWAFDLVFQHQLIVDLLSPSFPSATAISLNEGVEWRCDPDTKKWKPVMLAPELYRSLLSAGEQPFWMMVNATDFEGLFIGLFKEEDLTAEILHRLGSCEACASADVDNAARLGSPDGSVGVEEFFLATFPLADE